MGANQISPIFPKVLPWAISLLCFQPVVPTMWIVFYWACHSLEWCPFLNFECKGNHSVSYRQEYLAYSGKYAIFAPK